MTHPRFEIDPVTNEIVWPEPRVRIPRISWQCRQRQVARFLTEFYAQRKRLPCGFVDADPQRKKRGDARGALHAFDFADLCAACWQNGMLALSRYHEEHFAHLYLLPRPTVHPCLAAIHE